MVSSRFPKLVPAATMLESPLLQMMPGHWMPEVDLSGSVDLDDRDSM